MIHQKFPSCTCTDTAIRKQTSYQPPKSGQVLDIQNNRSSSYKSRGPGIRCTSSCSLQPTEGNSLAWGLDNKQPHPTTHLHEQGSAQPWSTEHYPRNQVRTQFVICCSIPLTSSPSWEHQSTSVNYFLGLTKTGVASYLPQRLIPGTIPVRFGYTTTAEVCLECFGIWNM